MPSLATYYTGLGKAMDDLAAYSSASGTGSTVVISELISAASGASTKRYDGFWVYNATKALQRLARTGGYAPSTGTVTVDPTWTGPSAADAIKITHLFPVIEQVLSDETSYRKLINRALSYILLEKDEITTPVLAGAVVYTGLPVWLDRPERLAMDDPDGWIREPSPHSSITTPVDSRSRGWELVPDAEGPKLRVKVPFVTTSGGPYNLTIVTNRPAVTWIKVGSTWAESTVGLVNETDEAVPDETTVVEVALREAYRDLMHRGASAPAGKWADKFADQDAKVRRLRMYDHTLDREQAPQQPQGAAA